MELLEAIILGIIQGITEWLPISSEGMVSLATLGLLKKDFAEILPFIVWLHLGTLLAAVVYFWQDVKRLCAAVPQYLSSKKKQKMFPVLHFLMLSTLVTAIIGGGIYFLGLESLTLSSSLVMGLIGILLIVTGILQYAAKRAKGLRTMPEAKDSYTTGIAQGLAILPGLSRSGLTIAVLLFLKMKSKDALKLSFLMSIPVVLVAVGGMLALQQMVVDAAALAALVASFAVGLLTISALLKMAQKIDFSWSCVVFGVLSVVAAFL